MVFLKQRWVRPFLTLAAVVALATVFSPTRDGFPVFWNLDNQLNVLRQVSETGILATAMTLVIISGGIDLSVGSLLALSGTVFAYTFARKDWPLAMAVSAALFATTSFGLASGAIVARMRMQPFIVTLAAMIGSRGFARWVVDNATIDIGFGSGYVDRVIAFLALKRVVVPTFLAVAFAGYVLLRFTRFGRYLVAVGGSEVAARLSGMNVGWVKVRVYALSGFLAGIAGIIHACQNHQGSPNAGVAYELDAIAAAVIGGTSLAGGKGGIAGTVVGTLALGVLSNLLGLNNVDENMQWMLKAAIIVGAVWLQSVGARKETLA
ncbi:MAG: ABC transporter permease [Candidatus Hydrogenedentes bacterium]|nr:ABC transporter permease [Candidatus Hydrogenedentota bacterium]